MLLAAPVPTDASGGEPAGLMYLGVSLGVPLDIILGVSGAFCKPGAHDDELGAVARIRTPVSHRDFFLISHFFCFLGAVARIRTPVSQRANARRHA